MPPCQTGRGGPPREAPSDCGGKESATPTPLSDQTRRPARSPRFHSGAAAFRRPCHRTPRRSAHQTGHGGPPARSAFGLRREGVGDAHAAFRPDPSSSLIAPGFTAVPRPSEGLVTALHGAPRARQVAAVSPREAPWSAPGRSAATPRRFATGPVAHAGRPRFQSGAAAFRRPCHRSPKALRAEDRPSGSPARSAVGVRGVGASATPTPLCDEAHHHPAASGFIAVSRPSEGLAAAVRWRCARVGTRRPRSFEGLPNQRGRIHGFPIHPRPPGLPAEAPGSREGAS